GLFCERRGGKAGLCHCRLEFFPVPAHCQVQTLLNSMRRSIAEKSLRFADISVGMPDVTRTKIFINRFLFGQRGIRPSHGILNEPKQLVEGRGLAECDVKDLVER